MRAPVPTGESAVFHAGLLPPPAPFGYHRCDVIRPVVKWAGGKGKLLNELLSHVPASMGTYIEPFCGGAAVFFALAGHSPRPFERAILCDQNEDLMACYRALRDDLTGLVRALRKYRYDRELFYETRAKDPSNLKDAARGARFLFLNKTCFNGLWRVNSKGQFNVPFGTYKNPKILDEEGLEEASRALAGVELVTGDYRTVTKRAKRGDFVYLDPPYVPLSRTAQFTAYSMAGFGPNDQVKLAGELARLAKKGVKAMLSNHDTKETEELYKGFWTRVVKVRRSINSDITKRGDTREIIVTNWDASASDEAVVRAAAGQGR